MTAEAEPPLGGGTKLCPGVARDAQWDAPDALRGEIYTSERLLEHAVEIAKSHGKPSMRVTPGPLRRRVAAARVRIREAYAIIGASVRGRDASPAEEWLLDNSHVIEDQMREIDEDLPGGYLVKLPRIATGVMSGYPRVYGLCIDYLRHTDARIDVDSLADYVKAYQTVHPLTIGELWAVPIMLRLGLLFTVGALAQIEARARDRAWAEEWGDRLVEEAPSPRGVRARLKELEAQRVIPPALLVQLLRRFREHDSLSGPITDWVAEICAGFGTTPEELVRIHHLRQAADQVSVGNSVTSMRAISALDWNDFFERTSAVEAVLRMDPVGAYPAMEIASRDRYRHIVENVARRSPLDERAVASTALDLATAASSADDPARRHVGYYLVDDGVIELERKVQYRVPLARRAVRSLLAHPTPYYLGAIAVTTMLVAWLVQRWGGPVGVWAVLWLLLALLPASEVAVALVNSLVVAVLPPRLLTKLDFRKGVPAECRTLVVVPSLLDGPRVVDQLLESLEVRALANFDPNVHFALLTDFTDADTETRPGDVELLERARRGIAELNQRHGGGDRHAFGLVHRRRVWNGAEQRFMGWERKRGKLEELNRLLRGGRATTTFEVVTFPEEVLREVTFVLTLDADTSLPRDVARRLVGTIAHPLNRPRFDAAGRRVARGYGIIQPRVGTLPLSSRRSRFARICAGPPGIDPYTTAVSDVYQDLFGEGSFVGKGIYDVDAFARALDGRVPDDSLLSHDLFEGVFARAGLATDIEVLDEQPDAYEVEASRQHRWLRGDWQLLPWLAPRVPARGGGRGPNDFHVLDWWKVFDNLRRSVLPPAIVAFALVGWFQGRAGARVVTALLLAVLFAPALARLVLGMFREQSQAQGASMRALGGDLKANAGQAFVNAAFWLDQALLSIDAIARVLYRMFVSRRGLLEWTTMRQAARQARSGVLGSDRQWLGAGLSAVALGSVVTLLPTTAAFAVPFLALWMLSPFLSGWLRGGRRAAPAERVLDEDRDLFRAVARKTWRFFETFVGAEDNYLPPDNYQEDPRGVAAHRTSSTNIGLYLVSVVAARDFGFVTARGAIERLQRSFASIERLEMLNGHLLNWYDTLTLAPLEPRYVSTVDSGNLAAYLWALREACAELSRTPIAGHESPRAVGDALRLALQAAGPADGSDLHRRLEALIEVAYAEESGALRLAAVRQRLLGLSEGIAQARSVAASGLDARYWLDEAEACAVAWLEEIDTLAPFVACLERSPELPSSSPVVETLRALEERLRLAATPDAIVMATPLACAACDEIEQAIGATGSTSDAIEGVVAYLRDLRENLERSAGACLELTKAAADVGERSGSLADGMDFAFLYDEGRKLFSIGYNAAIGRLDPSHYDLLASEARLASLLAIAKGDVPQEHWFRMGRPRTAAGSHRLLLSWSGSMFEYLMPLLVTRCPDDTLLRETCEAAVLRHMQYGAEQGIQWGISESAYSVMDLGMTYQYRAFGVPGLGLKPGLGDYLVIAPYATVLAALVRPAEAAENLRALTRDGIEGAYGYFEAADFTKMHVPPGKKRVVVKAYMAHHQGMTLVALSEVVNGDPMRRRFHADPRIKATELLLEERVPVGAPIVGVRATTLSTPVVDDAQLDLTEHVSSGPPRVHLLGHGDVSTIVSSTGTGMLLWRGLAVNRFREDPVLDAGGIYFYVRNVTQNTVWSSGLHPTRTVPAFYDAAFSMDRVEFHRRDGHIETATEIVVSPEHPVEIRRITVTNHGKTACDLDVTSYTEVVLAPRTADIAHRAFQSLFVETEAVPERGAMLARRRPRSEADQETWVVQALVPMGEGFGELEYDGSRATFLGRGNGPDAPEALARGQKLARSTGTVLDPAICLRRAVRLQPGQRATLTLTTGLAHSRERALELAAVYSASHGVARAFELAWADSRVELKHLAITATEVHRYQRLLSAIVFPRESLRSAHDRGDRGREALWALGISGDLPIVLLSLDDAEFGEICREILVAQEFFRLNGVSIDVVLLNLEPSGYLSPVQEAALDVIRTSPAHGRCDQRGGVFLRRSDQMGEGDRAIVLSAARVVLHSSKGSLTRQLRKAAEAVHALPPVMVPSRRPTRAVRETPEVPELAFGNGIGGFTPDGREYMLSVGARSRTPAPWCNVLANAHFGTVVGESGGAFTFHGNAQKNRLTPWSNDATQDPPGETLYVRDDVDGTLWSATPRPAGGDAQYLVAHGQGYTRFTHRRDGLASELTVYVAATEPVKVSRLVLENYGDRPRRLSVYGMVEWVLGPNLETSRVTVLTEWEAGAQAMLARNPLAASPGRVAFYGTSASPSSFTADREEFFGLPGSRARPQALLRTRLSGRAGGGLDPCAAIQTSVTLEPGQSATVCFFLGQGDDREHAVRLASAYRDEAHCEAVLTEARQEWDACLGAMTVETPDAALDFMVNRWLLYQVIACRLWARSGFYQSSGAYGFRDQLQDVMATLHARPELAREQLLRAAARQFVEGDVQHWWHPETGEGVRTHCSDDMAWLPFCTAEYVRVTGDHALLEERIGFLRERQLEPDDHDLFTTPETTQEAATIYEHCVRALDVACTAGPHGIPTMRGGDWNDGMDRVGAGGTGESIWLGWFLVKTLSAFVPLAERAKDAARVEKCRAEIARITAAIEAHGWDGSWYRRAYFDDGTPLGSAGRAECSIDSIAQSWSVIAGTGDPERAAQAVAEAEAALVREDIGIMMLLTPSFEHEDPNPGYIRSYPAGLRENGGQYTHGVIWTVLALTLLGEGDRAHRLLSLLNPVHHGDSAEAVARYKIEPFVVAGDVYSAKGNEGRGGWSWYTGAASWMYRITVENVLGFRREGNRVTFAPCFPRAWTKAALRYRHAGGELSVEILNPDGVSCGVLRVEVDGAPSRDGSVTLGTGGGVQNVRVVLGEAGKGGAPDPRHMSRNGGAPAHPPGR